MKNSLRNYVILSFTLCLYNLSVGQSMVYSANGCWTPDYELRMLSIDDTFNLLIDPWTVSANTVFYSNPDISAYGLGHHSFFK
ncbi:hypothetical protein [Flavivirga sp. 57AJ16]|uniref:hypothetical protein n=1 Tax=Flavivirga sp. 57AJ16 TaxID=3025307 RepID=UPI002366A381|nr:hypothetical protein [Flavivirga sp. 57AJ16]MDD7885121.1 hypothetical protein [Flavivirga sp. 57AJ16]